jgi:hypothetical protein
MQLLLEMALMREIAERVHEEAGCERGRSCVNGLQLTVLAFQAKLTTKPGR